LPYNTSINSVYPTFGFKSSARQTLFFDKDTVPLTGTDTINFTKYNKIKNYATDLIHFRIYPIKVNVHQVKPELYVWSKVIDDIDSHNATSQKAVLFNNTIFYYLNNGTESYLYTSNDGYNWQPLSDKLTGLPVNTPLNDMTVFNDKLYLTRDGGNVYSSADGINWSKVVVNYNFKSLLYSFKGSLWAVVQSQTELPYRFATFTEAAGWVIRGEIPTNFPVRDFASIAYSSRNGFPKVLIFGGYAKDSTLLKNNWTSEDGANWFDFRDSNHTLDTLATGSSVISYDKKLFVFGLRTDNSKAYYKQSIDEGMSWQTLDTLYNRLRQVVITKISSTKNDTVYTEYVPRSYQSVLVFNPKTYNTADSKDVNLKSNRIFIIGGKTANGVVKSDVWTGKLNRKNFLLQ
jgi:hypothetical protein